jgi:hypothetical protein
MPVFMCRCHLVTDKMFKVVIKTGFRPNWIWLRVLSKRQMDDRNPLRSIQQFEKCIVAVLSATNLADGNAEQDVLTA